MAAIAPGSASPVHTPPGQGRALNVLGELVHVKVSAQDSAGALSIFEITSPPGSGPPLHVHTREDEAYVVLEGEYHFQIGDQRIRAGRGATLFSPRNTPHTFSNMTDRPARLLVMTTPGGFENFFLDIDRAAATGPLTPADAARIIESHGMRVLGPPLATTSVGTQA